MGDDLDDLLDEIESKMTQKQAKTDNANNNAHRPHRKGQAEVNNQGSKSRVAGNARRQDLNDALDDIFDDGPHLDLSTSNGSARLNSALRQGEGDESATTKCFPLLIGGSGDAVGLSTTVSKKCCATLRCYNCDFKVEMFDNYRWSPDTDYLFLRNNMPDFSKLQPRLLSRRQSRAYACQCQWTHEQEMTELSGDLKRLWHCSGKHE